MTAVVSPRRALRAGSPPRAASGALAVALLTLIGAALRIHFAGQSLFGDELNTYWLVSTKGLGQMVSAIDAETEITPPLFFVLSWLATRIDLAPELIRAPSLLAGTAAIPLAYGLGLRTVGRAAAVIAAALVAFAPFMVFYSAEARGYELMLVLVMLSTLALLNAVDGGGARWWVAYGACTCAAVLTHYTAVFALGVQLLWVLWAHPEARRPALLANAGAVIAFLPWLSGLINDFRSPDSKIAPALTPFDLFNVRLGLEHWTVGYPFVTPATELRDMPGVPGLALQAVGLAAAIVSVVVARIRTRSLQVDRRLLLVVALALSAPVAELVVSALGTHLFTPRNLAVSWPWFALSLAAVLAAPGRRVSLIASTLVIAGFGIAAVKTTQQGFERPDYRSAAAFIDRTASRSEVVIDDAAALVAPGPLTGIDVGFTRPHPILRVNAPQQREHNFRPGDVVVPTEDVIRRATARPGRIFVVTGASAFATGPDSWDERFAPRRRVDTRIFPAFGPLTVLVYAQRSLPRR
jgi:hypothetical protein